MAWKAQILIIFILVVSAYCAEDQPKGDKLDSKNTTNTQPNGTEQNKDPSKANVDNGAADKKSNATSEQPNGSNQPNQGDQGNNNSTNKKDSPQDKSNQGNSNSPDPKNIFYFVLLYPDNKDKAPQDNKPNATNSQPSVPEQPKNNTSPDKPKDPAGQKNGTEPKKDQTPVDNKPNANNPNTPEGTNPKNVTEGKKSENATKPKDDDEHHAAKSSYALRNSQPDDRLTSNQNKGTVAVRPKKEPEPEINKNKDNVDTPKNVDKPKKNPIANNTKSVIQPVPTPNLNTSVSPSHDEQPTKNVSNNNNTPVKYIVINPNNPAPNNAVPNVGVLLANPSPVPTSGLSYVAVPNVNPGQMYYRMPNPNYYAVPNIAQTPMVPVNNGPVYVPVQIQNPGVGQVLVPSVTQQYVPVNTDKLVVAGQQRSIGIPVQTNGHKYVVLQNNTSNIRPAPINTAPINVQQYVTSSAQPLQNKVLVLNNGQRYLLKEGQPVNGKKSHVWRLVPIDKSSGKN